MNHETPAQRRTRLIDEYVLRNFHPYATCGNLPWLIQIAQKVADAAIAATPQEHLQDDKLAEHVERLERSTNELYRLCTSAAGIMRYGISNAYSPQEWLKAWDALRVKCLGVK